MTAKRRTHGFVKLAALGLLSAPLVLLAASGMTQPPPAPTTPPATAPKAPPAADPGDTIKKLEEQRKKDNPPAPANPAPAERQPTPIADVPVEAATTGTRLVRENTFMTQRRGRMTRSTTNEWVFTFDADTKGKSEPAMVLMPCMNLQNMEKAIERTGEGTSFTLSGTVYVYKGRNYILPTMFVVNRRSELAPAQ